MSGVKERGRSGVGVRSGGGWGVGVGEGEEWDEWEGRSGSG